MEMTQQAAHAHGLRGKLPGAQACIDVVPKNAANFNVDNVRVVKIPGGGAGDSRVLKGVVVKRGAEGNIKDAADAKVAVFAQGVDTASTETKASALRPSHTSQGLHLSLLSHRALDPSTQVRGCICHWLKCLLLPGA
jgi:hypothetical protein